MDHAQVVLEASGGLTWDVWRPSAGSGPPPTKVGQTDLARHLQAVLESLGHQRRLFAERPALTAGELLDVMQEFKGKGAGPRRKRS